LKNVWISDEDYCTAIHEAAHAVAVEWTGVGEVQSVEIGLLRIRPQDDVLGLVRWKGFGSEYEATLATSEAGHRLLQACLVVLVAAPLAVARVTGERDRGWASYVEGHRRYDLDDLVTPQPSDCSRNYVSDYVRARWLCTRLGLTLAEGMALGEAFLNEPGVMAAVHRIADAVLMSAPAYRLDRRDFLAALQLPPAARRRYSAVRSARRILVRRSLRRRFGEPNMMVPLLILALSWLVRLLSFS
jgi:hypothetical protein